jgi:hypothetical protein
MNAEILKLCNQLFNVLHALDQHVAPADLSGKRLLYEAQDRLKAIATEAEQK